MNKDGLREATEVPDLKDGATELTKETEKKMNFEGGTQMSVAKVSEISATSTKSFEDAIQQGLARSAKTLRNVRGAWVKEQHVRCTDGRITEYQVNMMVTFVLDE
jgi:flavin-binding protein dodecin